MESGFTTRMMKAKHGGSVLDVGKSVNAIQPKSCIVANADQEIKRSGK